MLDLKGVMNAAIVKFEMLDKDHQGRLTQEQLAQELTPQEFKEANPTATRRSAPRNGLPW